ncbi:Cell division control protein 25 [Pleurostoma richardsiae]|uniref:Cell division control protein 25 n=1 Tax=Pleurostoma richardsiae TaxID=41990 RepID=A0AA38VFT8_9PEZI|nr:Cell division control protein 25 [Pleurostoma richardsiae]
MVMLSENPLRSSLQVAPLSINKSRSDADNGSIKSDQTITAHPYTSTQMTPPTTPNGSQEDLNTQTNAPAVFHNFLRAFYPFHPSYAMTDSTVTLPLNEGDVILVHSIHTNGWADGTLLVSGARGWLPTNYCEAYEPEEMHNLLTALLNFWDLLRSTAVTDNEIFGNQEFMKGIIAGVRYLLERTHCLTRESATIQRHDGLRRGRKSLLSELSSLVKTAKRLQEHQKMVDPIEDVNDIIDEMILKAFRIVTKGVRFLDVLEEDRRLRAPAITVMATLVEESYIPPTPPADSGSFDGSQQMADAASRADTTGLTAEAISLGPSDAAQTPNPTNKRLSAVYTSGTNPRRLSQNSSIQINRLSSTISHRVSLAGPSPLSRPQNLVSERLTASHDTFLSYLGSFIGRLHLQSQSRPHLALAIKQSATSGGELLVVVDVVCAHSSLTKELLDEPRAAMYDRIRDLVHAARDILVNAEPDVADVIMPQDNSRLLYAATGCVRATGECVAKTKWVIERIGDFEFEFDNGAFGIDLDLDVLDMIEEEKEKSVAMSDVASVVESNASSSAVSETPAAATTATASPAHAPRPPALSIDKPLPKVPEITSPADTDTYVVKTQSSPTTSRPQSLLVEDTASSMASSVSSLRPALPPLPRLSTTLLPQDEYSSSEHSAGHDSDFTSSFRSESMTASSSGTGSSYVSRDSEASLVSRTSTRATTPDHALVPKSQPSMSELSTTGSSTLAEEVDDVESKLLEKTFAHELMFNKEGQVTGGSLPALVERLTTHESTPDAMFVSTFYLTFRLFCTPIKLAEALIDRFEYVGDSPHMAAPVRLRVYNVFKGWLESHWRDETDREALSLIEPFAEFNLASVLPSAGKRLLELTQRVASTGGATLVPRLVSSMGKTNTSVSQYIPADTPLPAPNISKSQINFLHNWKTGGVCPIVLDFDPLEVARQLTIKQMSIFCSIMPEELLGSQWMKRGGVDSPNVKAMTALSTDLSNLVAETILHYNEVKKRASVIKQWIKIAHQCLELHNYDALMAIICSLNSSTITRLRRTWDIISPKRKETLKMLQAIVEPSQNNKVLRARLHDHVPPCLPFQGMFLTDLTFVDIGNPPTKQLPGTDGSSELTVVNFDKHTRTAKIIGELQRFQIPYRLTEVPELQEWIQAQIVRVREAESQGNNVQVSYYRKSLLLEPRETQMLRTPVEGPAPAGNGQKSDLFGWMRGGGDKPTTAAV